MVLIGIHGKAESGKDTACQFLQEELTSLNVRREAFADRLKVSAARALGFKGRKEDCINLCNLLKTGATIRVDMPYGAKGWSISGRTYLQLYGTEAHREVFDTDFWVKAVPLDLAADVIVITDVRFDNEGEYIKEKGGEVWHVIRGDQISESEHASEQPISQHLIDKTILNDGSLDDYRKAVLKAWSKPKLPHLERALKNHGLLSN